MTSTNEVCKAFFNFSHELNKGHGVISSIYELIRRTRENNPTYFDNLSERIERAACGCRKIEDYEQLLNMCWSNTDNLVGSKWTSMAYTFYVTDKVDMIARRKLPQLTYFGFKDVAEIALKTHLKFKYGEISSHAWDIMNITENLLSVPKKETFSSLILTFATIYAAYDLYKRL